MTGSEYVIVALDRPGALALLAGAEVGLEGADPDVATVDVEAGLVTLATLRRALEGDADTEEAIVRDALAVLVRLTGERSMCPLPPDDRAALARLVQLLRAQEVNDAHV